MLKESKKENQENENQEKETKTWCIPVTFEMCGCVFVEAPTLAEAMQIVKKDEDDIPLPIEQEYVDGSFGPTFDDEEYIRLWWNAGLEDCVDPKRLVLTYIGTDSWSRPVYQDAAGKLYVDTDPREYRAPAICTKYQNQLEGEPDCPVADDIEIVFLPQRYTW